MDIEDKLELLFNNIAGRVVEEAFIENDAFTIIFDNGTLLELYSEDGDLDLYYEINPDEIQLH